MLNIRENSDGVTLPVKAKPGAKRNAILGEHAGGLRVAVTAPPEDGKANDAIVEFLRKTLGLARGDVELLAGRGSRDKVFLIRNRTAAELLALIARAS